MRGWTLTLLFACNQATDKTPAADDSQQVAVDDSASPDSPAKDDSGGGSEGGGSGGSGGSEGGTEGGSGGSGGDDSAADDSGGSDDTGEPVEENVVRFVALGDAGEGNDMQYTVAAAMESVCAARGCDFALYLGDNFYESGVDSIDDALFESAFELPYYYLDFPFYAVLGNHDYGGNGLGYEYWKIDYEIAYTDVSEKWTMPDNYYQFAQGPVDFFGIDTNEIMWGYGDDQLTWLQGALAGSTNTWRVVFGHHPYISNGTHGNAGNYEGLDWLPIINGADVQTFMEDGVCGAADIYICGHDHDRQWLEPTCGTEFIVSGAGSKLTDIVDRDGNAVFFEESKEGFLWMEISDTKVTGTLYDYEGNAEYTREISR